MKNRSIFFDKDNTLIKDQVYNCDFNKVEFFKDSLETLKYLSTKDYLIFIVSNQSGINRNYFSKSYYLKQMKLLIDFLKKNEIKITDHIFCPHLPEDNCLCRKPKIGMIKRLEAYYNIDLSKSYYVGDRYTDIEMAINSGINPIFINRGYPEINDKLENKRNDIKKLYSLSENMKKLINQNKIFNIDSLFELKKIIKH